MSRRSGRPDVAVLAAGIRERHTRRLAQAVSLAESRDPERRSLIAQLYSSVGKARVVGVTGPPGAGKSTLVDRLAGVLRQNGDTVGILAIDPTSPFSGGAILGDRIRMQSHYTDDAVFIRSMATRGAMGGLAPATHDAIDILDAAGFDWILVETVGVGQDEVDIARSVDTVVVVTLPGLGDDIQAIKAGLMEIADVFVINKADREGVDRSKRDLELMISMADNLRWRPPIVTTVASQGQGVEDVLREVDRHGEWLQESGELRERRKTHLRVRIENLLKERILVAANEIVGLDREVERGLAEHKDPYLSAEHLFAAVIEAGGGTGASS
ncbi:MAG: methylmalonyl Co-A mutase-associated GTPase MeaB [Thermoanaerobaculia bacterium]